MRFPTALYIVALCAACGGGPAPTCIDADRDGYGNGTTCLGLDCDDTDPDAHPGAIDVQGDGIDSDCNNTERCFADADDDGVRTDLVALSANADCDDPGEAYGGEPSGDCDDHDALAYPGASEIVGSGKDESCDGEELCFHDGDHDRARTTAVATNHDLDCDDVGEALASARIDCDDTTSDDTPYTYFTDADRDGFGVAGTGEVSCTPIADRVQDDSDCDDEDATAFRHVDAMVDVDGDGFGAGATSSLCAGIEPPLGFATASGDCATQDPTAYPGAPELPDDGVDQDCVGGDLAVLTAPGVFVRTGASDANPGTRASPVGTLARAYALAAGGHIFVAAGAYPLDASDIASDASIFGGYASDFASRGDETATVIALHGGLGVSGGTFALERLTLDVSDEDDEAAAAIFVLDGRLTLRDVAIVRSGVGDARGLIASDATVVADRIRVTTADAGTCEGVVAIGGRLLLVRSRIETCQPSGGDATGVRVINEEPGKAALAAIVADVIDVASRGVGVRLVDTRSHVIVAQTTIHIEADDANGATRGVAIDAPSGGATRLSLINSIIDVSGEGADAACVALPDDPRVLASLQGNDLYVASAGQCRVRAGGACVAAAAIDACTFATCLTSTDNLSVDPGYADVGRHLAETSMCVDAGVSVSSTMPTALFTHDIDGDARPVGAGVDIGADELVP